jgi:hypothetical protein
MQVVGELRTACEVTMDGSRSAGALGSRRIEGRRGRDENPRPSFTAGSQARFHRQSILLSYHNSEVRSLARKIGVARNLAARPMGSKETCRRRRLWV